MANGKWDSLDWRVDIFRICETYCLSYKKVDIKRISVFKPKLAALDSGYSLVQLHCEP